MKILHTGDLHIGNFPGPEENGENARFKDICICLEEMVVKAKSERPDITVIAGDVFHQARVWSDRGLKENQTAIRFIRELGEICTVVVMRGTPNHDSEQQFESLKSTFRGVSGIHIVTEPAILAFENMSGEKVNIACLPGFDRGYYRAQHPGLSKEEENEAFTRSIADMIVGLKAQCDADAYTVLASHYTITGCNMESGQTAFFSQFEPVVYPDTLQAAGFDLSCFGHIHRPQQIEWCKNTFYCGAISALNFNDEGQERGFYIHDLQGEQVTSVFHRLPTREYKTIYLDDHDVEKIISNPAELSLDKDYDVEFKVVRVIYDCTDEHNKSFNHAAYERLLYDAGAFWVQEITPRKISISVDKKSMDVDNSPESNLAEFIKAKEVEESTVLRAIELARPIISEATEKATTEKQTGVLMPISIQVKNYRNYREETFSYEDIKFCTINGENGVGKSSLFMDAIRDALFEEPREGDLTGWICNDPAVRSGAIIFTFALGKKIFRVTRTRTKSGKGTLNISEYVMGEWQDRSKEKYKDTQREIENITGMDSLMLTSCALIMQDQYGVFLGADKEARMNIIGNILGLSIYEDMEQAASERFTEVNREIKKLQDQTQTILDGIPDTFSLEKEIEQAERSLEEIRKLETEKTEGVDLLKVTLNTQREAQERALKLNAKIAKIAADKAAKEAQKSAQIATYTDAESRLSRKEEIQKGVEKYNRLADLEKDWIRIKAELAAAIAERESVDADSGKAECAIVSLEKKKESITRRIEQINIAIGNAQDCKEQHDEYVKAVNAIEELEQHEADYQIKIAEMAEIEKNITDIKGRIATLSTSYDIKLSGLKKRTELLENSGCPDIENAKCRFLQDALLAKKEIPECEAVYRKEKEEAEIFLVKMEEDLQKKKEEIEQHPYSTEKLRQLKKQKVECCNGYEEYNALDGFRKELKLTLERSEELEKEIEEQNASAEKLAKKLELAGQKVKDLGQKIADLGYDEKEKQAAAHWINDEKDITAAEEQKKAAAQRILEITEEVQKIEADQEEAKADYEKVKDSVSGTETIEQKVKDAEQEISELKEQEQRLILSIGGKKQQRDQAIEHIKQAKEKQDQANKISCDAAAYEILKTAFSQDGIPHNIVRSVIPVFEATATNILGQMSHGRMSVEFALERILKSNSKKEVATLDIIINDADTGRLPYMSRSGGERVKAALAVILALSEIMKSKAGIQLGFLFIDEPPFLDDAGTQAYCTALETIQQRYPDTKVMAITHDNAFKARFPQSVTVTKDIDGSHVVID